MDNNRISLGETCRALKKPRDKMNGAESRFAEGLATPGPYLVEVFL